MCHGREAQENQTIAFIWTSKLLRTTLLVFTFPKQCFILLNSPLIAFLLLTVPQLNKSIGFHFLIHLRQIFGHTANFHLVCSSRDYFYFHVIFLITVELCFGSVRYLLSSVQLVAKNKAACASSSIASTVLFWPPEKGFYCSNNKFWRNFYCFSDIANRGLLNSIIFVTQFLFIFTNKQVIGSFNFYITQIIIYY